MESNTTVLSPYALEVNASTLVDCPNESDWQDDVHFALANDPLDSQTSFGKVNASVSFGPADGIWELSLIGKNLSDELAANSGDSTAAIGQPGDVGPTPNFKFPEPGRQIALQLRYRN
jgi:hypothetical protein